MPENFRYHFEWDPEKAARNRRKHGVGFEQAADVFQDLLALSRPDEEATAFECRWITLGDSARGQLLVVVHTYRELDDHTAIVRVISARRVTRHERRQYESTP